MESKENLLTGSDLGGFLVFFELKQGWNASSSERREQSILDDAGGSRLSLELTVEVFVLIMIEIGKSLICTTS